MSGDLTSWQILGWTAVSVGLPYLVGDLVGEVLHRKRPPAWALVIGALGVTTGSLAAADLAGRPGMWDTMFALGLAGWAAARRLWQWRVTRAEVVQWLYFLGLAEFLGQVLLPAPPGLPTVTAGPLARVRTELASPLGTHPVQELDACALVYGPVPEGGGGTIHFGDSVPHGVGVEPEQAFPALLPGQHVSATTSGVSTDVLLAAARRWLDAGHYDLAILYVYEGNDLAELGATYPCCPGGPLLDADLALRCPAAVVESDLVTWMRRSPPPFALRAVAEVSRTARWTWIFLANLLRPGAAFRPLIEEELRRVPRLVTMVEAFVAEARSHDAEPLVVYLPRSGPKEAFEGDWYDALPRDALHDALVASDVPLLDGRLLASPIQWTGMTSDGIHLTREGHEVVARWLGEALARRVEAQDAGP